MFLSSMAPGTVMTSRVACRQAADASRPTEGRGLPSATNLNQGTRHVLQPV